MIRGDELDALIENLRWAGERSRLLDAAIAEATAELKIHGRRISRGYAGVPPRFTEEGGAAIILVSQILPGWGRNLYWNPCQGHLARVEDYEGAGREGHVEEFEAIGATAGLALCGALLKAVRRHTA